MAKNCRDYYEPLISRKIDGDLSGEEFERLEEHLTICGHCRSKESSYLKLKSTLAGSLSIIDDRFKQKKPRQFPIKKMYYIPAAAATALILVFSLVRITAGHDAFISMIKESNIKSQKEWSYKPMNSYVKNKYKKKKKIKGKKRLDVIKKYLDDEKENNGYKSLINRQEKSPVA